MGCHSRHASVDASNAEEQLRHTEGQRLRALVAGDTAAAGPFHATEFQLVNPVGRTQNRAQYLGAIANGELDYVAWEPAAIDVRTYGQSAVLRYQSRLVVVVRGDTIRPFEHWHTDVYERRNSKWHVVWSQATAIR